MITQLLPEHRQLAGAEDLEAFYLSPGPPHLRVNFISSLDGVVEVEGRSGPLGGPADRAAFMAMRAGADVILVGAGTVRAEDYGPVRMGEDVRARRKARGQPDRPPLAVVTERGDLDPAARVFSEPGQVLVLTTGAVVSGRPDLARVAELVACGDSHVDVIAMVAELHRRGLGRVLCEGGPALTRSLLGAGQIDELCLTVAPILVGAGRRLIEPGTRIGPGRFVLTGLLESDSLLMARYQVGAGR